MLMISNLVFKDIRPKVIMGNFGTLAPDGEELVRFPRVNGTPIRTQIVRPNAVEKMFRMHSATDINDHLRLGMYLYNNV